MRAHGNSSLLCRLRCTSPKAAVAALPMPVTTATTRKHGEQLHKKLPGQFAFMPWWVEGAGHNDVRQVSGDTYVYKLMSFIHYLKGAKDGNGENNAGCSTIDRNNGKGKKSSIDPENDMHVVATVGAEKNDGAMGRGKDAGDAFQEQRFRVVAPIGKKKTSSMVHPEIVVQSI